MKRRQYLSWMVWGAVALVVCLLSYTFTVFPAMALLERGYLPFGTLRIYTPLVAAWETVFPGNPVPTVLDPVARYHRLQQLIRTIK